MPILKQVNAYRQGVDCLGLGALGVNGRSRGHGVSFWGNENVLKLMVVTAA